MSNQEHSRSKTPSGQKDTDFDFVSFLRTRSSSSVSSSKQVRPYSLSMHTEDYYYAPKPKHLRSAQLLRVLGSSFDPFWMSIERPAEAGVWTSKEGSIDTEAWGGPNAPLPNAKNKGFNVSASPELSEGAARYQKKLEKDAEDLDFRELPAEVASTVRDWLVRSATCRLRYRWVNLAPVFWPPWMRHTDCEHLSDSRSCSFPSGMTCQRAQTTQIKILAWHCWGSEEVGGINRGTVVVGAGVTGGKRCLWRQVPYPVVTACKCSCK
ncbi:noggin [Esox lucius]|nr:noggin [Esox lucius]